MKYLHFKAFKRYLLFIIFAILCFWIFVYLEKNTQKYFFQLNSDNDLNPQSVHVLNQVVGSQSLVFEAFTHPDSAIAKKIAQFFYPYQRVNNQLKLKFIDPLSNPNEVNANGISLQGEIVLKFLNKESSKKINITELSESSIINAILKLFNDKDQWLVVAEGFGMATLDDESELGLSNFVIHLKKIGHKIARMPLNKAIVLPENVKVIILPAPTQELDADTTEWLKVQIDNGISIMWLTDVGVKNQTNLELMLDVMTSSKIFLDKDSYSDYLTSYSIHSITENFNQPIYIAEAREVFGEDYEPLFVNTENVSYAVTKQLDNSRIIITGDSDFIRNQYINIAANKSMSIRMIDWLLYNDESVNIPVKINTNTQLLLNQTQLLILSVVFLIILPVLFIIIAIVQWRKNHGN